MPDAYDLDGGVNQEKRFSVAVQRYRLVMLREIAVTVSLAHGVLHDRTLVLEGQFSLLRKLMTIQGIHRKLILFHFDHSRDPEAAEKMNPFAEQEAWEEHQIGKI